MKINNILAIFSTLMLTTYAFTVNAAEDNRGWNITDSGSGTVEICNEAAYSGSDGLHVCNVTDDGDITVYHTVSDKESVNRYYTVSFYVKGEYNPDNIRIGWGTKETDSKYPERITIMPLSHEKINVEEKEDGWKKYSYSVASKGNAIDKMSFTFKSGSGDIFIDDVSIDFDTVVDVSRDADGYKLYGQKLLADGGFEKKIAVDDGEDISDYGWTSDNNNALIRIVSDKNTNKYMYVEHNGSGSVVLTKNVDIPEDEFFVTFRMKGAYKPSDIYVAGIVDTMYQPLVGGAGSSVDNSFGDNVTVSEEEDGWYKYTVKTGGRGSVLRLKIGTGCLGAYIDDISLKGISETKFPIENGDFNTVIYDRKKVFAEHWTNISENENNYVQREYLSDDYMIYLKNTDSKTGFYQKIENDDSESYVLSFDVVSASGKIKLKVGTGNSPDTFKGIDFATADREELDNGWTRYSFSSVASEEYLYIFSDGVNDVYIDNVSLKNTNGEEMILNGDFSIKTQPPEFEADEFILYKGNKEAETIGAGKYKVKIEVENNFIEPDKSFTLILSHVRGTEQVKYEEKNCVLMPNSDEEIPTVLECEIDLSDYKSGDVLEVFLWDSLENMELIRSYCAYSAL